MAQTLPDVNTAMNTLQQGFTSWNGFGQMVSQAYAAPGAPYIASIMVIVIIAVATYIKTQNVAVTTTTIALLVGIWGTVVASSHVGSVLVQVILGMAVLAAAWMLVKKVIMYE